ncbi:hypothetical protein RRG08_033486 [Elysia crispata]|uniref:Uncharacterized protein n=1 Tax=Elysia crispata TaxID=231223 RepID=A0AAE1ATU8_9GAST|nr:hypothetical protein RRG08_033486 [Elysia crispata]
MIVPAKVSNISRRVPWCVSREMAISPASSRACVWLDMVVRDVTYDREPGTTPQCQHLTDTRDLSSPVNPQPVSSLLSPHLLFLAPLTPLSRTSIDLKTSQH